MQVNDPPAESFAVSSYGWSTAEHPHTHDYLAAPIVTLCQQVQAKRVLDLGCGNGALCGALVRAGFTTVGCDVDRRAIDIAQKAVPAARFKALGVYDDPSGLAEPPFDVVIATEVVEHLFAPRALPRFARRVLHPGGYLILSTPYHGYWKNLVISLLGKWDWHFGALWDGGHIKFWSRRTLEELVKQDGFTPRRFLGVGRVPWLWKSMILTSQLAIS